MSPTAQAKFLRVLQEREYQRLGGTRQLTAKVRAIAATNRDLRQAVTRGAFREGLYYRLEWFDIKLPPPRERTADILPLRCISRRHRADVWTAAKIGRASCRERG